VIAVVTRPEGSDGRVVLSLRRVRNQRRWVQLEEMQRSGSVIEAVVIEANRGGVVVDVGLRGFVPLSQIVSIGAIDTRERGIPKPVKALVGKRLRVLEAERSPGRKDADPTSLYPLGTSVRVVVVDIDRERQRISLSIKRTRADPWERYVNELETGQTVAATVTRVMPYGAFACLGDGVEGLIHVGEFAGERVADPTGSVHAGDALPVRIVAIDRERRRLSLSARLPERT
jgi:small subunit ribosomal protein S1